MMALSTENLTKTYGVVDAVSRINLRVPRGTIYGFIGRNGAGKTTALRLALGLARPTSGSIRVLEGTCTDRKVRARIGYLPDVPAFVEWMTAREALEFAARTYGLKPGIARSRIRALEAMAGLEGNNSRVGDYSRGMRQRLGIAQALINAPDLLILDEPTSALDPLGRRDVLQMISALRGSATVIFSTHLLADVERVCDHVGILHRGQLLAQGTLDSIRGPHPSLRLQLTGPIGPIASEIAARPWCKKARIVSASDCGLEMVLVGDLPAAQRELPGLLASRGLGLRHLSEERPSLDEAFTKVTS